MQAQLCETAVARKQGNDGLQTRQIAPMLGVKSLGLGGMKIPSIVGFAVVILIAGVAYIAGQAPVPNVAAAPPAPAAEPARPPVKPLSGQEAKELIAKVKATWRAQDGETIEAITSKVAKVAQFVPRGWDIAQGDDGSKSVVLSWARHQADKEGDEYTISWDVDDDGTLTLGPPYAKPMELGWQAFALSLIQGEIDEDDESKGANRRFLHDISNLNFVQTAQGKLGDLLKRGRCSLGDPVGVDYVQKLSPDKDGDFFRLQLSVNCNISGPQYFTHDGVVIFVKRGTEAWQPQSFFAHRIANYPPGSWFDHVDPKEQEAFEAARKAFERGGLSR